MLVKAKSDQQAISASRLIDGVAVWRTAAGEWSERVAEAAVFSKTDVADALEAARADIAARVVVDVYPLDVAITEAGPVPTHVRERMKAIGPSVHPAFGKQAAGDVSFSL